MTATRTVNKIPEQKMEEFHLLIMETGQKDVFPNIFKYFDRSFQMKKSLKNKKTNSQKKLQKMNTNSHSDGLYKKHSHVNSNRLQDNSDSSISISDTEINSTSKHIFLNREQPSDQIFSSMSFKKNQEHSRINRKKEKVLDCKLAIKTKENTRTNCKIANFGINSSESDTMSVNSVEKTQRSTSNFKKNAHLHGRHYGDIDEDTISRSNGPLVSKKRFTSGHDSSNEMSQLPNETLKIYKRTPIHGIQCFNQETNAFETDRSNTPAPLNSQRCYQKNFRYGLHTASLQKDLPLTPTLLPTANSPSVKPGLDKSNEISLEIYEQLHHKRKKYNFQQYTSTEQGLKKEFAPDFLSYQTKLRHIGRLKRPLTFTDVEFMEDSMNTKTTQKQDKNFNHKFKVQLSRNASNKKSALCNVSINPFSKQTQGTGTSPPRDSISKNRHGSVDLPKKPILQKEHVSSHQQTHESPSAFRYIKHISNRQNNLVFSANADKNRPKRYNTFDLYNYGNRCDVSADSIVNKYICDKLIQNETRYDDLSKPKYGHDNFTDINRNLHLSPPHGLVYAHSRSPDRSHHASNDYLYTKPIPGDDDSSDRMMYDAAKILLKLKNSKK